MPLRSLLDEDVVGNPPHFQYRPRRLYFAGYYALPCRSHAVTIVDTLFTNLD